MMNPDMQLVRECALVALNEAKAAALAYSTLAGVLVDTDSAETLMTAFNTVLDPLIEKYKRLGATNCDGGQQQ